VALSNIFPRECNVWRAAMKDTRERFQKELSQGQNKALEDLDHQQASLRRVLQDAVVEDVVKLYP